MSNAWISASILSANWATMGHDIEMIIKAGADRIHVDVMDNHYVPNLTFGPKMVADIRKAGINSPLDVHLMVSPVDELITAFADAGATSIVFHPEASQHVDRSLGLIQDAGCEAGLALNPATPLEVLTHVLDLCGRVLLMSVNPGFGGQAFIPSVLEKSQTLTQTITDKGLSTLIEVDGGVTHQNSGSLFERGVRSFVTGSYLFGAQDRPQAIAAIRETFK